LTATARRVRKRNGNMYDSPLKDFPISMMEDWPGLVNSFELVCQSPALRGAATY
jgi:hypothetical protein